MGSPLSSILSEIYLNSFENNHIFTNNKLASKIVFYKRYVDDTFVIFNGNSRQIQLLNNHLNSISPSLQFTLETEQDRSINFLDLTIIKNNNSLSFRIYRKPTTTDHTIHATSNHPQSHKMAAYHSFVNRLLKVPMSPEDYNNEYTILKFIAVNNGYPSNIIDKIMKKQKQNRPTPTTEPNRKFVSIDFGSNLHFTLKNELNKHNITLATKASNKLEYHLSTSTRNKHTNNSLEDSGVYQLTCSDCPKLYIGQSGRSFSKRFTEHLPKPKLKNQRSKFAEHLTSANHSVNSCSENLHILHKCKKGPLMNALESFEIYRAIKKSPDDVLNEKLNLGSNILFDRIEAIVKGTSDNSNQLFPPPQGQCNQTGIG
jgi:hypothetical protein